MVFKIASVKGNHRLSTQELLQEIYAALENGEHEFEIEASGQHNLGGPLWSANGPLKFTIKNPGQRVGSMALEGTTIVVEGSASADVGWLNAGGAIIIKGDGGDTTAHCAASGNIYIGGRVGTRSGSLMKHDPKYEPPQLWVLKNTGSFCFEFMGGGVAVVCGLDSAQYDSVLGDRACAGMVGGTVYFRGKATGISEATTKVVELNEQDKLFLTKGLPQFLEKIGRTDIKPAQLLNFSEWKKIIAKTYEERSKKNLTGTIQDFRAKEWITGGIFGDIFADDNRVLGLVNRGTDRLYIPEWLNAMFAAPCEAGCPAGIPSQTRFGLLRDNKTAEAYKLVLEYTPFPGSVCGGVCPNMCMTACTRCIIDSPANIKALGRQSYDLNVDLKVKDTGKKVAIVGSGVGGLTAAWLLRLRGHEVTVFERDQNIGGKIVQAVSRERLETKVIEKEIERIKSIGINFKTGIEVDQALLEKLKKEYTYVILSTGAYKPKLPPWPGVEKVKPYLEFLKAVNSGKKPNIGKKVVVIGCGNSGMDVVMAAYTCGAQKVTAIDIQKPNAFEDEIEHVKKLGAEIIWPAFTKEITDQGVILQDDRLLEADSVFLTIGEVPELKEIKDPQINRGYLAVAPNYHLQDNVYALGDMTKLGLLAEAIGAARTVALQINAALNGEQYASKPKIRIPTQRLSLGYFSAADTTDYDDAKAESTRCISCGTCRDCEMCLRSCPEKAITRVVNTQEDTFEYVSDPDKCIGCGICQGVCPCGIWTMKDNA